MSRQIVISTFRHKRRLEALRRMLGGELFRDCEEHVLKIENKGVNGSIRSLGFDYGLGVSHFKLFTERELKLTYTLGRRHPILFLFCLHGQVELESGEQTLKVEEGRSIIYAPKGDEDYTLNFLRQESCEIVIVDVVRMLFLRKIKCDVQTVPGELREMFLDTVGAHSFSYECEGNAVLHSIADRVFSEVHIGLEQKLMLEARVLDLINESIKTFRRENEEGDHRYAFKSDDISRINTAKNQIIDQLHDPPTVSKLARQAGMSASKLQEGFKMIFGKSVRQFIISLRMHKAMSMLGENGHSIGEIANLVGYTNKGHFSELFKKEFGILPSEYVDQNKIAHVQFSERSSSIH